MEEKRGPKDKELREKRRKEVFDFIKSIGPYSVPANVLADKHGCTVKMIYNDRDYWIKTIKFKDISFEGKRILMGLMKNMAITEELKANGDATQRLRAVLASNSTAEVFTKMLEQYGFKEKVADKHEFEGLPTTLQLIEMSDGEIKNEKEKHKQNLAENKGKQEANADNKGS